MDMKKNYKTLQKSVKRFMRNYLLKYSEITWNINMQLYGLDTDEWLVKPTKVLQVVGNWREWKNQRQFIEDKSKQKNTCSEQWSPDNSVFRIMGTFGNQIVWLQNNIYWHAYNSVSLSSYDCFSKTIFFVVFTVNIYMTVLTDVKVFSIVFYFTSNC